MEFILKSGTKLTEDDLIEIKAFLGFFEPTTHPVIREIPTPVQPSPWYPNYPSQVLYST